MELKFSRKGDPFWGCPRFPQCRGSRDYVMPSAPPTPAKRQAPATPTPRSASRQPGPRSRTPQLGSLVKADSNDLGVGRVIQADQKAAKVEYFDSPGQPPEDRHSEFVLLTDVLPYGLVPETRVFFETDGGWRSGRVDYQAPDKQVAVRVADDLRMLSPDSLYVRWDRPLADPSGYARVGLFESPHNYERRAPVLRGMSEQLRATRGMPGLLSIAAELHPHQLATARRVLDDHTQRYLLADEVGLGKTIEALLVLRQLLLDDPHLTAQLIVPDHLQGQWQAEVDQKLLPSHFPWAEVRISGHGDPDSWEEADVIVVDEAHGLVSTDRAERLRAIAHASPRLLLLSATPALHNEERFLEMLHLLDPTVYPRDGLDALRARVEARRDLGRAVVGLSPDAPAFALAGSLAALRSTLQSEGELLALLEAVEGAKSAKTRSTAIQDLRGAVADVFQVHRRMIRNRRTSGLVERFPVAQRHGTRILEIDRASWQEPVELLEQIAEAAAAQGEEAGDLLTSVMDAFPDVAAMAESVDGTKLAATATEVSADDLVRAFADALTYKVRRDDRTLIFAPTANLARALAAELRDLLGPCVATILSGDDPTRSRSTVEAFAERGGRWLVCDTSAQEGTNLQMADQMVHLGLPGRVDALEQRIGRVDRWTQQREEGQTWQSLTIVPPLGFAHRWATVVDQGFNVHATSLASLQRAVEETSRESLVAVADPTCDVDVVIARVQQRLDEERQAVREQDAIDEVTLDAEERETVALTIRADEEAEGDGGFAEAFGELMFGQAGHLRFIRAGEPIHGVGRFEFNDPSSRRGELLPLVPLSRLRRDFIGIKDQGYSGRRSIALARSVAPLRIGSPVIDAVHDFLRHDDRGRAWGLWRYDPSHDRDTEVWWRVDILVRPTVDDPPQGTDPAVLQRTLDGAFPPTPTTVWFLGSDQIEPIGDIPPILHRPYQKVRLVTEGHVDRHLRSSRLFALERVLRRPLDELVDDVRERAVAAATSNVTFVESQRAAISYLKARARRRTAAFRRRQATTKAEQKSISDDLRLIDRTLKGSIAAVREPQITIDAFGVLVLSGEWPWDEEP
jgi:ATP-dependent helicase HepA